jgi:hypothetical protein
MPLRNIRKAFAVIILLFALSAACCAYLITEQGARTFNNEQNAAEMRSAIVVGQQRQTWLTHWQDLLFKPDQPKRRAKIIININANNTPYIGLTVKYQLTLRPGDPVATMNQSGAGHLYPGALVNAIFGSIDLGRTGTQWAPGFSCSPTCFDSGTIQPITIVRTAKSANVILSSVLVAKCYCSAQDLTLFLGAANPGTTSTWIKHTIYYVSISVHGASLGGAKGLYVRSQSARKLTARLPDRTAGTYVFLDHPHSNRPSGARRASINNGANYAIISGQVLLAPSILVMLVSAIATWLGLRVFRRRLLSVSAIVMLTVSAVMIISLTIADVYSGYLSLPSISVLGTATIVLWAVAPCAAYAILLSQSVGRPSRAATPTLAVYICVATGVVSLLLCFSFTKEPPHDAVLVATTLLIGAAASVLVTRLFGHSQNQILAAATGLITVSTFAGAQLLNLWWGQTDWPELVATVMLGLLWGPVFAFVSCDILKFSKYAIFAGLVVSALLYLPVVELLTNPTGSGLLYSQISGLAVFDSSLYFPFVNFTLIAADAVVTMAVIAFLLYLRSAGQVASSQSDAAASTSALLVIAITTSPLISHFSASLTDVLASVTALITFGLLIPRGRADQAVRLARVRKETHRRLMRSQTRDRIVRLAEKQFSGSARRDLASGKITVGQFDDRWRSFGNARVFGKRSYLTLVERAARGSGAGDSPWRNGTVGAAIGTVIGLPLIIL